MAPPTVRSTPPPLSDGVSVHLDMIRGLAALAVFIGHARAFYFLDAASVPGLGAAGKLAYYLTGFGHQSVMVFFVLSGFLVGGSTLRSFESRRWSWSSYLSQRATRLYVVLLPALLLTAAWDMAGLTAFGAHGTVYGRDLHGAALGPINVQETLSPWVFLGNLGFLQTIRFPCFGTNSPLWSLANEGWYYLVFPFLVSAIRSSKDALTRAVHGVVAIALLALLPRPFLEGFVVWLFGASVAFATRRGWRPLGPPWPWRLIATTSLLGALHLARRGIAVPFVSPDLLVGTTFAVTLWTIVSDSSLAPRGLYARVARSLSGMSYTLYVVHFPVLAFVQAFAIPGARWVPNSSTVGIATLIVAGVGLYAYALSRFTEARTDRVRKWLTSLLKRTIAVSPSGA